MRLGDQRLENVPLFVLEIHGSLRGVLHGAVGEQLTSAQPFVRCLLETLDQVEDDLSEFIKAIGRKYKYERFSSPSDLKEKIMRRIRDARS